MPRLSAYTEPSAIVIRRMFSVMLDPKKWAEAFKIGVDSAIKLKNNIKRDGFSSLLTAGLLVFVYAGAMVVAEGGDLARGLARAFLVSDAKRAEVVRREMAADMQAELRVTQLANQQIQLRLIRLLVGTPTAARARVAVFHNGVFTVTGVGLLRFDVTHVEAKPGRAIGEMPVNVPLSQMSDYLSALLAGKCVVVEVGALRDTAAVARMRRLNIAAFLACPIINAEGHILGALFTSWDDGDDLPADMNPVIALHQQAATEIALALDLRPAPQSR